MRAVVWVDDVAGGTEVSEGDVVINNGVDVVGNCDVEVCEGKNGGGWWGGGGGGVGGDGVYGGGTCLLWIWILGFIGLSIRATLGLSLNVSLL